MWSNYGDTGGAGPGDKGRCYQPGPGQCWQICVTQGYQCQPSVTTSEERERNVSLLYQYKTRVDTKKPSFMIFYLCFVELQLFWGIMNLARKSSSYSDIWWEGNWKVQCPGTGVPWLIVRDPVWHQWDSYYEVLLAKAADTALWLADAGLVVITPGSQWDGMIGQFRI